MYGRRVGKPCVPNLVSRCWLFNTAFSKAPSIGAMEQWHWSTCIIDIALTEKLTTTAPMKDHRGAFYWVLSPTHMSRAAWRSISNVKKEDKNGTRKKPTTRKIRNGEKSDAQEKRGSVKMKKKRKFRFKAEISQACIIEINGFYWVMKRAYLLLQLSIVLLFLAVFLLDIFQIDFKEGTLLLQGIDLSKEKQLQLKGSGHYWTLLKIIVSIKT